MADDCHELTALRSFRDGYMRETATGASDICEYYHVAPVIDEKIKMLPNAKEVFDRIYSELVLPCVALIESGKNEEAYTAYKNYVEKLRTQYI